MKFAPFDVACAFATGDGNKKQPIGGCFGYHGVKNLGDAKAFLEDKYLK